MQIETKMILALLFLCFMVISNTWAIDYNFPQSMGIRDGLKVHFGDSWISTSGTDIFVDEFGSWVSYDVDGSGSQQVYKGSEPSSVFIDEVKKSEGDGWSYSDSTSIVSVTDATSKASLYFGTVTSPHTTGVSGTSTFTVLFRVWIGDSPLEGCMIEVFELPQNYYQGAVHSDLKGHARMDLDYGEYRWNAEYEGKLQNGTFLHADYQVIDVSFDKPKFESSQVLKLVLALVVVCGAVMVILKVKGR